MTKLQRDRLILEGMDRAEGLNLDQVMGLHLATAIIILKNCGFDPEEATRRGTDCYLEMIGMHLATLPDRN